MKGKPRMETAANSYFPVFAVPVCLMASFVLIAPFKLLRHYGRLPCVCFDTFYTRRQSHILVFFVDEDMAVGEYTVSHGKPRPRSF